MGLFDFNWSDGQDSLWDDRRGFWGNIGNLGWNAAGGALGGAAGFFTGGPLGAAAGAAAGWSGGNALFDQLDGIGDGTYERNAVFDWGTVGAGTVAGGAALFGGAGAGAAGGGAGAAGGGAAAAGGSGAAGGAATGAGGAGISSFLQSQGGMLALDALQGGATALFNNYAQEKKAAQEKAEKIEYYERNKAAANATYEANVDTTALKFLQNDLAVRQQAFDYEMTGRMARSSAVAATGASNLAGVSARETFNAISSQTAKGARRYQTQRKNAADGFYQDIRNLQVARDNQINSVIDPRQFEVSDDIKGLQKIAPWIEFGVGMLGNVGDAVGQSNNVSDIREGLK